MTKCWLKSLRQKMNKKYSITTDLFTIPYKDDNLILYAPRIGFACVANTDLINLLADIDTINMESISKEQRDILNFLEEREVLNGSAEFNCITNPSPKYMPTQVTLFPTNKCNLRCTYCYATAGDFKPLTMKWSTATDAIDRVIENVKEVGGKSLQLGFHGGGEPLYPWNLIKRIVSYANEQCSKENLGMNVYSATNGVLNVDQLNWIITHFSNLNISFDGLPHVQDYHRPCSNGKGSFTYLDRTMHFLDEHNFNYSVRCTVSSYNLDLMDEIVHFIGQNYNVKLLHFEPLFYCGRCKTSNLMQPDLKKFAYNFMRCESVCIPYNIKLTYSGSHIDCLRNSFCGTTRDNFAVTSDGYITTCFEITNRDDPKSDTFFIGRITEEGQVEIDEKKRTYLNSLTVDKLEYCMDCFAKWHCAGDCVNKIGHEDYGGARGHDRCILNRQLLANRLVKLVEGAVKDPQVQDYTKLRENNIIRNLKLEYDINEEKNNAGRS